VESDRQVKKVELQTFERSGLNKLGRGQRS